MGTSEIFIESSKTDDPESRNHYEGDSIISGLAPALLLSQCFSLFALRNVACQHGRDPHFRWLSLRILFSTMISSLLIIATCLVVSFYIQAICSATIAAKLFFFYISSFLVSCLFYRLSSRWASLCAAFHDLENQTSFFGNSRGLKRRMRIITAAVLISALVEHCVAQTNVILHVTANASNDSEREWLHRYYETQFEFISFHFPFSRLIVLLAVLNNIFATFIWNFNDLFIMLISVAIASNFRLLGDYLKATSHEDKDITSWRNLREAFNAISSLIQTVEDSLSVHVFLSFVNNSICICLQLLHTVRFNATSLTERCYYAVSFGSLVARAVSVCLFAAAIHENSGALKKSLFSIPSKEYSVEVERFIHQLSFDDLAFTGCNFFSITRSFLMTVFGSVATYEIVLIQFNSLSTN